MTSLYDRFFVLTGGPGSGKTTLIDALTAHGLATSREAGRDVIRQQVESGGDALPWLDRARFAGRMFERELDSYHEAERADGPVFFDRGLPDTIGYMRLEGLDVPAWMEEEAKRLRYNRRVFIAPPWPDIYCTDEDRRQSFGIAVRTYEAMAHVYDALGYEIAELPRASVKDRLAFLLAETGVTPSKRP